MATAVPTRYWFPCSKDLLGIGVTAWSQEEAEKMALQILSKHYSGAEIAGCVENIDIRNLDQKHVIPNMRLPNIVGVWFPMLVF